MDDLISRAMAINAIKEDKIDLTNPNVVTVFKDTGDFEKVETQVMTCDRHIEIIKNLQSAQPEGWMERNKERILQAGMEGREIEFRIGGRLFAIREKAQ